jgi:hypothetical protein
MALHRRRRPWARLIMMAIAATLFILSYQWGNDYQRRSVTPPTINGVLLNPAPKLPELRLRDTSGQVVDPTILTGRWTLLALGELADASGQRAVQRLIEIYNRVADQAALRAQLQLAIILTADTSELARQTSRLTPALRLLSGDGTAITTLRRTFGSDVDTSPTLYLIAPSGYLLALFPERESGTAIAEDLKTLAATGPLFFRSEIP